MEIIKKQISIDACRSHKQGLLPFIHNNGKPLRIDKNGEITYEEKDDEVINELIKDKDDNLIFINSATTSANTNYGHFVCDLKLENGKVIKYLDIIRRYNELKEIIRNGIFCEGIENGKLKIVEDKIFKLPNGSAFTCCEENECNCSEDIYEYICDEEDNIKQKYFSKHFYKIKPLNINDYINKDGRYYEHISGESSISGCCILIDNYNIYEEYEEWGLNNKISSESNVENFKFIHYIENNLIYGNNPGEFDLVTPTVDIPILLEEEYSIDTMYYPYEYTYSGSKTTIKINDNEYSGITGEEIVEISDASLDANDGHYDYIVYNKEKELYSGNTYIIESKLPIIVESKLQTLIHPTAINFGYNSDINDDVFGVPSGEPELIDKDGNIIEDKSLTDYRKVLFKSGISSEGYYLVEYYNDKNIISLPFLSGIPINVETVVIEHSELKEYQEKKCDVITKIDKETENGDIIIEYIIGATLNGTKYDERTGIHYQEKLKLHSRRIVINVDDISYEVEYEYLDYDTNLETVYNEEYKTYIDIRKAEIIGMPIGSIYNTSDKQPLVFTKEGSDSLISTPKIDIDLTFNRGNAAGWEKHFKLSECNTMQDLENYGNNFFNL